MPPLDSTPPQRQFGLRGLLLAMALLAVLLGLWRFSPLGIAAAIVLSIGVALVVWQARRSANLPDMALVVIGSLIVELALAWCAGCFGYPTAAIYYTGCVVRGLIALSALIELVGEIQITIWRKSLSWPDDVLWIGPCGCFLLMLLSLPLFYSLPMRDLGVIGYARWLGAEAIAFDCIYHQQDQTDWIPAVEEHFPNATINRLRGGNYHLIDHHRDAEYVIDRDSPGHWTVRVRTETMNWQWVGEWNE